MCLTSAVVYVLRTNSSLVMTFLSVLCWHLREIANSPDSRLGSVAIGTEEGRALTRRA